MFTRVGERTSPDFIPGIRHPLVIEISSAAKSLALGSYRRLVRFGDLISGTRPIGIMHHDSLVDRLSRRGRGKRKLPRIMTADEGEGEREREGGEDAERKTKSWGSKVVQPDPFGQKQVHTEPPYAVLACAG